MANNQRNVPAIASAARTATNNSADLRNELYTGTQVIIDMTAVTATGGVTFKVQGKDELSGKYYDLITSTSITGVSTTILKVYPGLTAAANLTVNDVLPRDYRILATHTNGVSMTYSVAANLIQ